VERTIAFKSALIALAIIIVLCTCATTSFAGTYSKTVKGKFSKQWPKPKSAGKYVTDKGTKHYVIIIYNYNTTLINEDTVQAYDDGAKHQARIKNGNGLHKGKTVGANTYSDLEVRHKGNTVTYSTYWH